MKNIARGIVFTGVFFCTGLHILPAEMPMFCAPMSVFMSVFPETKIIGKLAGVNFDFGEFPLFDAEQKAKISGKGKYLDAHVISVPHATMLMSAVDHYSYVNQCLLDEMRLKTEAPYGHPAGANTMEKPFYIPGKIAVVSNIYGFCYFHWINDIISKLAFLELTGVQYDYLCIPVSINFCGKQLPYIKQTLQLWGIDPQKILPAFEGLYFYADEIIMPTTVSSIDQDMAFCNYMQPAIMDCIRNKMTKNALAQSQASFSEKVFISRGDANGKRAIENEDEIFELFAQHGFERYSLSQMSLADQIALFYHATDIVSFHGAGLTNIIFCQPGTKIIEIFHNHVDASYWGFSHMRDLDYQAIDCGDGTVVSNVHAPRGAIPFEPIKNFVQKNY